LWSEETFLAYPKEVIWRAPCSDYTVTVMPKDKERSVNPALQQRKLEKVKALKKGKAELQARRNEKLARRNPDRLQRQVDDLKALEHSGSIRPREKQILEELEKDLRAVRKAREALGEKTPQHGNRPGLEKKERGDERGRNITLGKRRWNGERKGEKDQEQSSGSETDDSVRRIPMPKDTPPPIPQRRGNRQGTSANAEPLALNRGGERQPHEAPSIPVVTQPKTTYESAPQIRDLRKEAIGRFVPDVVRKKQDALKGTGALVEPEELDRLEREGYVRNKDDQGDVSLHQKSTLQPSASSGADADDEDAKRLAEEEERFRREMKHVQIEEVEDEDD
jgi:WW domain binding protein 11